MSNRRLILTVFFVFFLLILAHFFGLTKGPENLLRGLLSPVAKTVYHLGLQTQNWYGRYLSRQNLFLKNQDCFNQLEKKYLDQTELTLLRQENQSLRSQLNFSKQAKKIVMAEIIGKGVDKSSNVLIINRGQNDGLKIGNPVVADEGFLVGKIVKVEAASAMIQLMTDNQSRTAASILNQEKTLGAVQGEHGLSLKMTMIPQNETVNINDLIITSGLETGIPRGLIIGQVESIQKELYEPFQTANLRPLTDLNKVTVVSVLLSE